MRGASGNIWLENPRAEIITIGQRLQRQQQQQSDGRFHAQNPACNELITGRGEDEVEQGGPWQVTGFEVGSLITHRLTSTVTTTTTTTIASTSTSTSIISASHTITLAFLLPSILSPSAKLPVQPATFGLWINMDHGF